MPRTDGDITPILLAAMAQIRKVVKTANEATCFLSLWGDDTTKTPPANDVWYIVSPGDGGFDYEMWDGGGREQLVLDSQFAVTIFSGMQIDQAGRDTAMLLDGRRGLFAKAREVWNALAGFEPVDVNDSPICREALAPIAYRFIERKGRKHAGIVLTFRVLFDLDLPAEVP